jgi:hypothetical protein
MTRKTKVLYQEMLHKMRELLPEFKPTQVVADFEDAPVATVRAAFGDSVHVSGSLFRYAQALVKRICANCRRIPT